MNLLLLPLLFACQVEGSYDDTGSVHDTSAPDTADSGQPSDTSDSGERSDTADTGDTSDTDAPDTDTDTTCAPSVHLGVGETSFQELPHLGDVTLISGPQGGQHIVGAVQVCGDEWPAYVMFRIVHKASNTLIANSGQYGVVAPTDGSCCSTRVNMYGYIDTTQMPGGDTMTGNELLEGEVVILDMTGLSVSDPRQATVVLPGR